MFVILMFLGLLVWIGFMVGVVVFGLVFEIILFRVDVGVIVFFMIMMMVFVFKLVIVIDVIVWLDMCKVFGGLVCIVLSIGFEIFYLVMFVLIMVVVYMLFMGGLIFGKKIGWGV